MAETPKEIPPGLMRAPLRVALLAYDGMTLFDLAGPLQALTTANRSAPAGEPAQYETTVASGDGGAVVTSAGLPVLTVAVFSSAETPIDTPIAPPGGLRWGGVRSHARAARLHRAAGRVGAQALLRLHGAFRLPRPDSSMADA